MRKGFLGSAAIFLSALTAASAGSPVKHETYTRKVAIVLYDGVELLDFAGPGEVFQAASGFGASGDERAFDVYTVAPTTEPVTSQRFVRVVPTYGIANAPAPDIIVIPGGSSGALTRSPEFMAWLSSARAHAELTLTVCTGAFVLAEQGALDGRVATTWYGATARLQSRYPKISVQEGRRFVDIGDVVTTAGVSAGIDGSLHVVARLLGRAVAEATARYMEYHWTPEPYLAKSYAWLNPSLDAHGRQVQQADLAFARHDWTEAAARYQAAVSAVPDDARALYGLACARARLGEVDAALAALDGAVGAGFGNAERLRADADLDALRSDPRFAALLARLASGAGS